MSAGRIASFQDVDLVARRNEVAGQANGCFALLLQSSGETGDFFLCRVAILAGSSEIERESICSPAFQYERFAGPLCGGLGSLAALNAVELCSGSQFSAYLQSIERLVRRGKIAFEALNLLPLLVKRAPRSRQRSLHSLVGSEGGDLFADGENGFGLQAFDFALRHRQIPREQFGSLLLLFKGSSLKSRCVYNSTRPHACVGGAASHRIEFFARCARTVDFW